MGHWNFNHFHKKKTSTLTKAKPKQLPVVLKYVSLWYKEGLIFFFKSTFQFYSRAKQNSISKMTYRKKKELVYITSQFQKKKKILVFTKPRMTCIFTSRKRERSDSVLYLQEIQKAKRQHKKNATEKFDYIAISDRHKTVSWRAYNHLTGVVNLVNGPNLSTPHIRLFKRTRI